MDREVLLTSLAPAVRDVDPNQSIVDVRPLVERMASTVWQQRTMTAVLLGLAGLAVVLATVGIYGVLAYGVAQQHREIGVRRALGAEDADLRALVLAQGMRPVALGVCAGVLGSVAAWRIIESFAFGVPA